jgi:3-hydroxybutyryl-CoA dehydrogenase
MGGGIAQVLALSGADVAIADVSAEVANANRDRLLTESRAFVADGLFAPGATELLEARLAASPSIEEAVAGAEFIEEAVPERIELKQDALRRISSAASADAIIGSNTSTISIAELATAVEHPERFLGVHFSNPAPFIPGVELIPHATTSPEVAAAVGRIVVAAGKEFATVKDVTGFVLNRLQYALFHESTQLVEEGVASAAEIDTIVRTTFGFRLPFFGPFAIADMAGLDVYAFCYASLQTAFPERFATPAILQELVDAGKLGTKSGGGFLPTPADRIPELVAYRNRAYVAISRLLAELGPAPIE